MILANKSMDSLQNKKFSFTFHICSRYYYKSTANVTECDYICWKSMVCALRSAVSQDHSHCKSYQNVKSKKLDAWKVMASNYPLCKKYTKASALDKSIL